jgi:kinesin family protein 3/17
MSACESVKVVVRCRPLNAREKKLNCAKSVDIRAESGQIQLKKPVDNRLHLLDEAPPKLFTFDAVYDDDSEQRAVFLDTGSPLVESVLEGYNGTVFAYGQTGCGKTFSMMGEEDPPEMRGIIPNCFEHIFNAIEQDQSRKFLVTAAFIELYNEEVRDLLGDNPKQNLDLKESKEQGVFVAGLTHNIVRSVSEMDALQKRGNKNRTVGFTNMNADSSRSHSIFTIKIETSDSNDASDSGGRIRAGKLNLVDLAGSERQSKTGARGIRLKEATKINMSLSALGNVISALVASKGKHIPYRDSKLTRLLQDSLGGNTRTVMIACISPSTDSYDETLSTLRYANRAKNIKNKPIINEDPKEALLREYQSEIDRLRKMLQMRSEETPAEVAGSPQHGKVELSLESKQVRVVEGGSNGISQADVDSMREKLQAQHEERARALEKERQEARELQEKLREEWEKIRAIREEQERERSTTRQKLGQTENGLEPSGSQNDSREHSQNVDDRDDETLNEQQRKLEMAMDVNAERGIDLENQIDDVIREMEQQESMSSEEFEALLLKKEAEIEASKKELQRERDAANKRLEEHEAQTAEEAEKMKEALRLLEGQLIEGGKTVEEEKRRHELEMRKAQTSIIEQKRRERELNIEKEKAEEEKVRTTTSSGLPKL